MQGRMCWCLCSAVSQARGAGKAVLVGMPPQLCGGGEECWLSLPAVIRPPGGDHSKHALRITALLSQELHEAKMFFCHLFCWKLLAVNN